MKIDKLLKRYRIEHGKHFSLKDHDPADTDWAGVRAEAAVEGTHWRTASKS